MSNKLSVTIYGNKYTITSGEDPAYIRALGEEIDRLVTQIMRSGGASVNQALVLASFNYLDQFHKADEGADNLRRQIKEYADDAAKARAELAELRRQMKSGKQGASK